METLILTNANCFTFNPNLPNAESLVIQDRKIIAVGRLTKESMAAFPGVQVIDLEGRTILPAFTDAHIHLLEYGLSLSRVNCETVSKAACLDRVRERTRKTPPGKWVLGHGWNHNTWEGKAPNKTDLDSFSPENPVYLTHKSLHSGWVNPAALAAVGITKETSDPRGGKIGRLTDGEPDGIVYESAMRLVEKAVPQPNPADQESALLAAQTALHRYGISSVHDFDVWECYESLAKLETVGKLKLRVVKNIPYPNLDQAIAKGIKSADGSDMLSFGWVKLFGDGALGPQTAAMLTPYEGSLSTGMLFLDSEEIIEIGQKALAAGISLTVHAIGDRANREVLNGFSQLDRDASPGKTELKPRIEHVQLITPEDIFRLSRLEVIASMQPIHAVSDRDMADRHWGERCAQAYAWNSIHQTGAPLLFGSDAPVESPNPFWGIFSAVSRSSLGSGPARQTWTADQRLSLNEALRAYITQPHISARPGRRSGRLQAGYSADMIILENNLFSLPHQDIPSIMPAATMVNGEWVFKNLPAII